MQPVSSSLSLTHRPHPETPDGLLTAWLLLCCLLIFAMAVIGAVTRLTESGLSIMEWAPIVGIVPPLSQQEWERIFALYRQIPEYQEINAGMTLAEFKGIFWWEWLHRFWGRLMAIVFALPFFWFLWSARLRGLLAWKLGFALLLGALQGALGWYMVASGFAERTDVSQYRLVAHLALALAIYGWLLWIAFDGLAPAPAPSYGPRVWTLSRGLVAFLILLAVALAAGGFVAGLNAGLTYNSFPLMDGRWIPDGYGLLEPWYRNSFENVTAVQFNHRLLAALTLLLAIALAILGATQALSATAWRALLLLLAMALAQFALGVATLLWVVPIPLAAAHQAGALLLLSSALWALHQLRPGGAVTPPRN